MSVRLKMPHATDVTARGERQRRAHTRTACKLQARKELVFSHQDRLEEIRLPLRQLAVVRDGSHGLSLPLPFPALDFPFPPRGALLPCGLVAQVTIADKLFRAASN